MDRINISKLIVSGLMVIVMTSCNMKAKEEQKATDSTTVKVETAVDVKTKFVEVKGRRIAYRSLGNGTPFILCNRFRGNLDSWDPAFLDALAKDYNVITFDYTGFGLSTGTAPTDMTTFGNDIKDLASALGIQKFILGGWSFGGAVAQVFITQYPQLVSQGILIGTGPPGKNDAPIEPIFYERSSILNNTLDDETVLFFEPAWEASRNAAKVSHERLAQRIESDRDVIIPEKLWGNYRMGFVDYVEDKNGIREKILTSRVPMLVIIGDHDISFPVQNWYALVRKLQSAQLIVFPMAGHGPQHEFPEITAGYIRTFTGKL